MRAAAADVDAVAGIDLCKCLLCPADFISIARMINPENGRTTAARGSTIPCSQALRAGRLLVIARFSNRGARRWSLRSQALLN